MLPTPTTPNLTLSIGRAYGRAGSAVARRAGSGAIAPSTHHSSRSGAPRGAGRCPPPDRDGDVYPRSREILEFSSDRPQCRAMNKRDLAKAVAVHANVDLRTVTTVLDAYTDVVTHVVSKGEPVAMAGFAKFAKVERAARMGRNPATGEAIRIKASKKARITPVKAFKDAVLSPAQAPKLSRGSVADQRRRGEGGRQDRGPGGGEASAGQACRDDHEARPAAEYGPGDAPRAGAPGGGAQGAGQAPITREDRRRPCPGGRWGSTASVPRVSPW